MAFLGLLHNHNPYCIGVSIAGLLGLVEAPIQLLSDGEPEGKMV